MAKRKNLTSEDHYAIDAWEQSSNQRIPNLKNTIDINDISIKVKCLNEKQKLLKKAIENNEIVIGIGPAGCLINSEKIMIYKLKE